MDTQQRVPKRVLDSMLIAVVLGMTTLFYLLGEHKLVALHLFFLPVVLCGYYLGRGYAGLLALFSALAVSIAATLDSRGVAALDSPVMIGLALTVWAAALGLSAILIGTLCDQRARTVNELHKAYVGVVDVLSTYLQSANPGARDRSQRIVDLSQRVAFELKLPRKQMDDIRVAALLHDLEDVEITTQMISKAVHTLDSGSNHAASHTFLGTELVQSLSGVLDSALPLIVSQSHAASECWSTVEQEDGDNAPIGARVIAAVRAYDALIDRADGQEARDPASAVAEMRGLHCDSNDDVINALEHVVAAKGPGKAQHLEAIYN